MTDEVGFENNRGPNTKFVMRVVLTEEGEGGSIWEERRFNTYRCPRCKKKTKVEKGSTNASIDWYGFLVADHDLPGWHLNSWQSANDCGARFQATDVARSQTVDKSTNQDIELWLIRNIHVKQFVCLLTYSRSWTLTDELSLFFAGTRGAQWDQTVESTHRISDHDMVDLDSQWVRDLLSNVLT